MKLPLMALFLLSSTAQANIEPHRYAPLFDQYKGHVSLEHTVRQMLTDLGNGADSQHWSFHLTVPVTQNNQDITHGLDGLPGRGGERILSIPFKKDAFDSQEDLLKEVARIEAKIETRSDAQVPQCGLLPEASELMFETAKPETKRQLIYRCKEVDSKMTWQLQSAVETLRHL